jgi:2-dehydropantoate 2-reductase
MGQVPTNYALIGDGRVARHFRHFFQLKRISFGSWNRKTGTEHFLRELVHHSQIVLLAISDRAIEPFIFENQEMLKDKKIVHFSGSLLSKHAQGFHPLMTFGPELYDLATYEKICFITEKEGANTFQQVFPELQNKSFAIPGAKKAYYHALCVMANNFTTILWQKLMGDFESKLMVPRAAAFPFLEQTIRNIKTNTESALTGPLARKDWETVEKNIESLKGDRFQKIYESFSEVFHEHP